MLDDEAHHGLVVVVEDPQRLQAAAHARHGQDRPVLEHGREPVAQRSRREVAHEDALGCRHGGAQRRRAGSTIGDDELHSTVDAHELGRQPGRAESAVERVGSGPV